VSARLAGTGREAWLEEAPSRSPAALPVGESVSHRGKEALRVVRDPSTGESWIQVAGVRYRSLNDIRDRAVGERVLAAITHALRFSNGMVATDQGVIMLKLPPCDAVKVPTAFGALSDVREPGEILRLISDPDQGLRVGVGLIHPQGDDGAVAQVADFAHLRQRIEAGVESVIGGARADPAGSTKGGDPGVV